MTSTPTRPLTLHRLALSGHSHRVQLFASLLGLPLQLVDVDMLNGEHKTPRFLALNSFGQVPVLADVAMYSYTAHAPEGNVDLAPYPQVQAWLARVEALPGFVPMMRTPVGLAA